MSEPSVLSAVGIDAVHWAPGAAENITVRVRVRGGGRRRRGRSAWGGQPLLVIETERGMQRFSALPDPARSGAGAAETWHISFSVPASLFPRPGMGAWLKLGGGVTLPLPNPPAGEPIDAGPRPTATSALVRERDAQLQDARQLPGMQLADRITAAHRLVGAGAGREPSGDSEEPSEPLADQPRRSPSGLVPAMPMVQELELGRLALRAPPLRRSASGSRLARSSDAQLLDFERELIAERVDSGRRVAALERELRRLRARSARAHDAIAELRQELDALWAFATSPSESSVVAERKRDHGPAERRRARSSTGTASARPDGAPGSGSRAATNRWLERALQRLARRSPSLAGRLLVVLLPGAEMDQDQLVRLLAAGRLERRIKRVGETASRHSLQRVLSKPTSIADLRLEPGLSFALAAVMVNPQWTAGERFAIAYELPGGSRPGPYLGVNDGLPVTVTDAPENTDVATTIRCPADAVTAVLIGERPAGTEILGHARPLELIREWLERAQSG